ncbi:MAG: hypothetical protein AAB225_05055 [Acidobacteriota bacterium]
MTALNFISRLLKAPPPALVFELSEAGIAVARPGRPPQVGFQPLEAEVISVSPLRDNILRQDELAACVRTLAGTRETRKRHEAAVILPDASVRVLVLDFDTFPSDPEEQQPLVRFRIKKGLPFDLDSAALSYAPQAAGSGKRVDVVVAVAPLEILARYEAPFRASGLRPGLLTTSTLAALELMRDGAVSLLVKLSGRCLTISVLERGVLKLLRAIELAEASSAEVIAPLHPTFAYVEDQLSARPQRVDLCGFGTSTEALCQQLEREFEVTAEPVRSRLGAPEAHNAGLLGYLESLEESRP